MKPIGTGIAASVVALAAVACTYVEERPMAFVANEGGIVTEVELCEDEWIERLFLSTTAVGGGEEAWSWSVQASDGEGSQPIRVGRIPAGWTGDRFTPYPANRELSITLVTSHQTYRTVIEPEKLVEGRLSWGDGGPVSPQDFREMREDECSSHRPLFDFATPMLVTVAVAAGSVALLAVAMIVVVHLGRRHDRRRRLR